MMSHDSDTTNLQRNLVATLDQFFQQHVAFSNPTRVTERIESILRAGVAPELLRFLTQYLGGILEQTDKPDAVFERFSRFLIAARSPHALVLLFERDTESLDSLAKLFATSAWLAECMIEDPEAFDLLRMTGGQPIERAVLVDEINAECATADTVVAAQGILRRHRRRETLRIAYGDLLQGQPLEQTCEQLSFLADAILSAAIQTAFQLVASRKSDSSSPALPTNTLAEDRAENLSLCCIATGAYGGKELDYGAPLDVVFIGHDATGDSGFLRQWTDTVVTILSAADHLGPTYDLRFRILPGTDEALVFDPSQWVRYLEISGRTWHRHEFIKARPAAGDTRLGEEMLRRLQPWIYRRYLGTADLEGIRTLKRKLSRRSGQTTTEGAPTLNPNSDAKVDSPNAAVDTPDSGGDSELSQIAQSTSSEIDHVIRFLQLLNGSDLPNVRVGNTRRGIDALEQAGCLTMQERTLLSEHYVAFRRLGHRLQLADNPDAIPLAFGVAGDPQTLRADFIRRRSVCRRIVDHLVHDLFSDAEEIPIETEMVLDQDFDPTIATKVMSGYGFQAAAQAYECLLSLATESIRFLSDRRSRHFLAGIAPKLLEEISGTPNPDATLERFAAISNSLGGKAALFELFQTTPSTLRLCVRLCATSPYLTSILTNNPGMVDELIDSLLLDRLPQYHELEAGSRELCRFAEDVEPILHSIKNSAHLRIGVRDVLGRDGILETHRAIANVAEVCLRRMADDAWQFMVNRYGQPLDDAGRPVGLSMVALGKLGGREPNYHSDLDVLFLYDADGQTRPLAGGRRESTTNSHFFHELTQRIVKRSNHFGNGGRLFELDARIRFSHDRGAMAATIDQFRQHFSKGDCQLWQRLALVNARVIYSTELPINAWPILADRIDAQREIEQVIEQAILRPAWMPQMAGEAAQLRGVLQRGAAQENIKRGAGGTMDVEAIVQMLLLRHAADLKGKLGVGTLEGLELLRGKRWLSRDRAQQLATGYRYLRTVESNLRLMNLPARHDLPQTSEELRWLAFAVRETHWSIVAQKCDAYREINRQLFDTIFAEEAGESR
jgi:[glutamine synthetase] adenylyltransferase / [glutamine synthetase]-adenylyl-L-tyrosine phosphorylase